MAAFQNTRAETEQGVMVKLLSEIERNPSFTQRSLASELGIALGLMNGYLKRCITKGWIRASQISPRRITYFLTPEGFSEKTRIVKDYLARSFTFFRDARSQCEDIFQICLKEGWGKIALVGGGDLSDIAKLVAQGTGLSVSLIPMPNLKKFKEIDILSVYDVILITDVINPQESYDFLKTRIDPHRILTLPLLHISRGSKSMLGVV